MIENILGFKGALDIVITDASGRVKDERHLTNLVVNTGLAFIISRMAGVSKGVMSYMGLGSGTGAASASNTDLGSALGSRVALTSTTITGSNNEKIVYAATFGAGAATGAVTEAGVFNASSAGDMLCRTAFSVVNKDAADTMSVTWTITASAV